MKSWNKSFTTGNSKALGPKTDRWVRLCAGWGAYDTRTGGGWGRADWLFFVRFRLAYSGELWLFGLHKLQLVVGGEGAGVQDL